MNSRRSSTSTCRPPLDAWSARAGRTVEVHGIALPPHYGGLTLQQLIAGESLPPLRLTAPALVNLPNGPGTTLACLRLALLLVTDEQGRYVVMIQAPNEHDPGLQVEVAGLPVDLAQSLLAELDRLRAELNVYRGHLLEVSISPMGGVVLSFAGAPGVGRDAVVLPDTVLARVERHALGVAAHRDALLAAGQHLKRGLLLYGPPGTGKTHTTRYLLGQMSGYTRLVLTGRSLIAVGCSHRSGPRAAPFRRGARGRQPGRRGSLARPGVEPGPVRSARRHGRGGPRCRPAVPADHQPRRPARPALAARPGRVDVAVEIALPDAPARKRLLTLYGRSVPLALTGGDVDLAVDRTEGTTASFLKELIRRSVLESLHDDPELTAVTGDHLARALDDLLDAAQAVTRTLHGVGVNPAGLPAGGMLSPGPGPAGMMAYRRSRVARRFGPYG